MKYRLLGNSGLRVAEMSLGTMTFGEDWGWGSGKDEARKIYDAYRAAGGNFLDTANVYTNGTSETFLGEFIQGHRQEVVRRVEETLCTVDFPWLYPPFPASCPFRFIMVHRGLPPH